jgi:glycosyltransferase involved in cell wall biosynthesis
MTEGISLAVLEAMSAGVPVAALENEGNAEVLAGGAGLLVGTGGPRALAGAVDRLLADPALASDLARRGRERVAERYGFDRMVEAITRLYDRVTSRTPFPVAN